MDLLEKLAPRPRRLGQNTSWGTVVADVLVRRKGSVLTAVARWWAITTSRAEAPTSWNSAHSSHGCSQQNLIGTGEMESALTPGLPAGAHATAATRERWRREWESRSRSCFGSRPLATFCQLFPALPVTRDGILRRLAAIGGHWLPFHGRCHSACHSSRPPARAALP